MSASRLPAKFATSGLTIGIVFMGLYWLDYSYNPFRLPPPPLFYKLAEKAMFVLCPGLFLQVFTIGTSDRFSWMMWVLAVLLNGPVYYLMGLLAASIINSRHRRISSR
jgi:hypothetical protein